MELKIQISYLLGCIVFLAITIMPMPLAALELGSCLSNDQSFVLAENDEAILRWQENGALLLANKKGGRQVALWHSGTAGMGKSLCRLDNGNLVISRNKVQLTVKSQVALSRGQCFTEKRWLADNGVVKLVWQGDGNLVMYDATALKKKRPKALWASHTWNKGNKSLQRTLCFQKDGNLVIFNEDDQPIWETGTANVGETLALGSDCRLQVVNEAGLAVWSSPIRVQRAKLDVCNMENDLLWRAFEVNNGQIANQLRLDGCVAILENETGFLWESATRWCMPEIEQVYTVPGNTNFIPEPYHEWNKLDYTAMGAQTSAGGSWPGTWVRYTPYIRLYGGERFSQSYYELINTSLADFKKVGQLDNAISSIEFRGTWDLCQGVEFSGACIRVSAHELGRIEQISELYSDEWDDVISSVKLVGYTDPETGYFMKAHFADTRKICINTSLVDGQAGGGLLPYNVELFLKGARSEYFLNGGGKQSSCTVSVTGSVGRHCCDTGYNGVVEPVYVGWRMLGDSAVQPGVAVRGVTITEQNKLNQGLVGAEAMGDMRDVGLVVGRKSHQFCLRPSLCAKKKQ